MSLCPAGSPAISPSTIGCGLHYLERGSARVVCRVGLMSGVGEGRQPPDVGLGPRPLCVTNCVPGMKWTAGWPQEDFYCFVDLTRLNVQRRPQPEKARGV